MWIAPLFTYLFIDVCVHPVPEKLPQAAGPRYRTFFFEPVNRSNFYNIARHWSLQ